MLRKSVAQKQYVAIQLVLIYFNQKRNHLFMCVCLFLALVQEDIGLPDPADITEAALSKI